MRCFLESIVFSYAIFSFSFFSFFWDFPYFLVKFNTYTNQNFLIALRHLYYKLVVLKKWHSEFLLIKFERDFIFFYSNGFQSYSCRFKSLSLSQTYFIAHESSSCLMELAEIIWSHTLVSNQSDENVNVTSTSSISIQSCRV